MDKVEQYCEIYSRKIRYIGFHRWVVLSFLLIFHFLKIVIYYFDGKSNNAYDFYKIVVGNAAICIPIILIIFLFKRYNIMIWLANVSLCISYAAILGSMLLIKINRGLNLDSYFSDSRNDLTGLKRFSILFEYNINIIFSILTIVILLLSLVQFILHYKLFFYNDNKMDKKYEKYNALL